MVHQNGSHRQWMRYIKNVRRMYGSDPPNFVLPFVPQYVRTQERCALPMEATNLEWELLAADRSSSPSSSGCRRLSAAATHRRRHTAACLPAAVESAGSTGSRQQAAGGWRRHCRPRRHSLDADEAPPLAAATHRRRRTAVCLPAAAAPAWVSACTGNCLLSTQKFTAQYNNKRQSVLLFTLQYNDLKLSTIGVWRLNVSVFYRFLMT